MASACLSFVYERCSPTNKKKTVNKKQKKNKQNNNKQKKYNHLPWYLRAQPLFGTCQQRNNLIPCAVHGPSWYNLQASVVSVDCQKYRSSKLQQQYRLKTLPLSSQTDTILAFEHLHFMYFIRLSSDFSQSLVVTMLPS